MSGIVVFGREPAPGRVKTRLAGAIGPEAAAAVYRTLLDHTVAEAVATGLPVVLSLAAPPSAAWRPPAGVRVEVQAGADLGERMADAFARRFDEDWRRAVLVGSDCPGLVRGGLERALAGLADTPVVLGPAADGGYWLVGQRAPGVAMFAGVPWSSGQTLAATRRRLRSLGVGWRETETLADIDTVRDLKRAVAGACVPGLARRLAVAAVGMA